MLPVAASKSCTVYNNLEGNIDNPPKPVLINDRFPKDEAHVAQEFPDEEIAAIAHDVAHFK
jgi:hypothetical protein